MWSWLRRLIEHDKLIPLTVETTGSNDYGPCECCGNNSRCVCGFISAGQTTVAAYFVHWTLGRVHDHGASFDLIIGQWGKEARPTDRVLVSLALRRFDTGPEFMVVDACDRPAADTSVVAKMLKREEVIGKEIAEQAFALVDAIWLQDKRISELTGK